MSKKVMKLIDPYTGLMECKVCGSRHIANRKSGHYTDKKVHYHYGSWQCINKCKLD